MTNNRYKLGDVVVFWHPDERNRQAVGHVVATGMWGYTVEDTLGDYHQIQPSAIVELVDQRVMRERIGVALVLAAGVAGIVFIKWMGW